jgi:thiol-disulfide isomerase/thioredoxin
MRAMKSLRTWKAWTWVRDLVVVVLFVVALRTYQQRNLPSGRAPEFELVALDGARVSLEHYRGAPVLLHFWATWCGVCRAEQSSIDSIARELPVLSVASQSGGANEVAAYVKAHGIQPRVLVDASNALANRYGVGSFPTTFVLAPDGKIRFVEVGYTSELGLRARMWLAGL